MTYPIAELLPRGYLKSLLLHCSPVWSSHFFIGVVVLLFEISFDLSYRYNSGLQAMGSRRGSDPSPIREEAPQWQESTKETRIARIRMLSSGDRPTSKIYKNNN